MRTLFLSLFTYKIRMYKKKNESYRGNLGDIRDIVARTESKHDCRACKWKNDNFLNKKKMQDGSILSAHISIYFVSLSPITILNLFVSLVKLVTKVQNIYSNIFFFSRHQSLLYKCTAILHDCDRYIEKSPQTLSTLYGHTLYTF